MMKIYIKVKSKILLFTMIMLLLGQLTLAQSLTGVVTSSENGEPLAGTSILLKGTKIGVTTDEKGKFSLKAVSGTTLIFSLVGYEKLEITLGNQTNLTVKLVTDNKMLEEAVVIGYGTVRKKDLVGAVGIAKSKEFGEVSASSAEQLIQGKLAGVQVVNTSGLPGQGTRIFIRGTGTFTNPDPLYVIDGLIGDINSVAWQDIDDMTVLKDASSVAIYGARAANGVILVTTKRAKAGTTKITYNFQYGVSNAAKRFDLLNAAQYVDLTKEIINNPGSIETTKLVTPEALIDRTNWQDEIFQSAPQSNHYLNISGGSEKVLYNVSLGHENQDGIFKPYNFQRTRLRFSLEENVGRFKFGQNINTTYYVFSGSLGSLESAIRMPPYAPVFDPTNLGGYTNITPLVDLQDAQNPAAEIALRESKRRGLSITSQLFAEVKITDWLKFRSQVRIGFNANSEYNYRQASRNGNLLIPREANEGSNFNIDPYFENFATADKLIGNHRINGVIGATYANNGYGRGLNANGANFTNDEIRNIGAAGIRSVTDSYANTSNNVGFSYFSRLQYGFKDKYLLTASIRRDYSPAFSEKNRYGDFPSVGVAWKISEEAFMKELTFISDLKVRASWGKTGNDRIGLFRTSVNVYRGNAPAVPGYSTGLDKNFNLGATLSTVANPDLRWEETTQTDIGVDLALLNNKLVLTADYYNRNSDGLLLDVLLPRSSGLGSSSGDKKASIPLNAASVVNKGLELAATFRDKVGKFGYSINGNISFNDNKVTSLGTSGGVPIRGGSFNDVASMTKTDVGTPIGAFWGYRMVRVAIDDADVKKFNELPKSGENKDAKEYQAGLKPGDIIFKDLNGDGVVDTKDQEFLGSPIPKIQYGANISMNYGNFDLMLGLTGVSGVELINSTTYLLEGTSKVFNHGVGILDRWRKPGDIAKNPKAGQGATGGLNLRASDRFVEDGSYLRVRNITVGYNLPKFKGAIGNVIQSVRIYVTLQNFITITKYTGLDPEVLSDNNDNDRKALFDRGLNGFTPPIPKTTMLGINIGF